MNTARFCRNQKVHSSTYHCNFVVSHPIPDDFNMIAVRSDDEEHEYLVFDQNNLDPVIPNLGLTVEWKVPTAGQFVAHQATDGTYSMYVATYGDKDREAFVIVNITEKDNT